MSSVFVSPTFPLIAYIWTMLLGWQVGRPGEKCVTEKYALWH